MGCSGSSGKAVLLKERLEGREGNTLTGAWPPPFQAQGSSRMGHVKIMVGRRLMQRRAGSGLWDDDSGAVVEAVSYNTQTAHCSCKESVIPPRACHFSPLTICSLQT